MNPSDYDRCLTLAAYSAYTALREYLSRHPTVSLHEAAASVASINSDASALDYTGGKTIYELIDPSLEWTNSRDGLRLVLLEFVTITKPWWIRLVPYGRTKVRTALTEDQLQCLREAGLFDKTPSADAIGWWDEIAALVRGTVDAEKMLRARDAERLSLEHERERLKRLGVELEPEWVSLDDNTLGYDITSYDLVEGVIINKLIEVKSTMSNRIFITRNEWRNAITAEPHFCFHVWRMSVKSLVTYDVAAMREHIPLDKGAGSWETISIELSF